MGKVEGRRQDGRFIYKARPQKGSISRIHIKIKIYRHGNRKMTYPSKNPIDPRNQIRNIEFQEDPACEVRNLVRLN